MMLDMKAQTMSFCNVRIGGCGVGASKSFFGKSGNVGQAGAAWQAGALSRDTMFELFRKGEILPDGRTNQDEEELIAGRRQESESKPRMDADFEQEETDGTENCKPRMAANGHEFSDLILSYGPRAGVASDLVSRHHCFFVVSFNISCVF